DGAGLNPIGSRNRRPFLKKERPGRAVRISLHDHGSINEVRQEKFCYLRIIAQQVAFTDSLIRPEQFREVCQLNVSPVNFDFSIGGVFRDQPLARSSTRRVEAAGPGTFRTGIACQSHCSKTRQPLTAQQYGVLLPHLEPKAGETVDEHEFSRIRASRSVLECGAARRLWSEGQKARRKDPMPSNVLRRQKRRKAAHSKTFGTGEADRCQSVLIEQSCVGIRARPWFSSESLRLNRGDDTGFLGSTLRRSRSPH